MNRATFVIVALALGSYGCDKGEEETTETPSETAEEGATAAEPEEEGPDLSQALSNILARIGGSKMLAGNMVVEVLPQASGEVRAVVTKAEGGEAVQSAKLTVAVKGTDGETHDVELEWNAEANAYVGAMAEGEVRPAPGPLRVTVTTDDDQEASGELEAVAVAPVPIYGGQTFVLGNIAAELRPDAAGTLTVVAANPDGALGMESNVDIKATVQGSDGQPYEIDLAYDEEANAYIGAMAEGVTIAPGAIVLSAVVDGTAHTSRVDTVSVVAPSHEGDIVAVGDMSVELVPSADNKITAYVIDPAGTEVQESAQVSVNLPGKPEPVQLTWDASVGAYVAAVPTDVDLTVAPLRVRVNHGGRARHGAIAARAGRRLGVQWRARLEGGAGGAIPPGHAPRLMAVADLQTRFRARHPGAVHAAVSVMGAGMRPGRIRAEVMAPTAPNLGATKAVQARLRAAGMINAPRVQVRAQAAMAARVTAMVNAPMAPMAPMAPRVSAMAGAGARAGGGMASAMASLMIGF